VDCHAIAIKNQWQIKALAAVGRLFLLREKVAD
jgi:hypothetical protein